jgi:predicted ATP-dependent protease
MCPLASASASRACGSPQLPVEAGTLTGIAGQQRAREAIEFGLRMTSAGYNIVVAGIPASGRNDLVRELVDAAARRQPTPPDWVYIHNFVEPRRPKVLSVPPGAAVGLSEKVESLIQSCRQALPAAFADESYEQRLQQALAASNLARKSALDALQEQAQALGVAVNATPLGLIPVPLFPDGHAVSGEEFAAMSEAERKPIEDRIGRVQEQIAATLRTLRHLESEDRVRILQVDRDVTRAVIGPAADELREHFGDLGLSEHINAIESDIVHNIDAFKRVAAAGVTPLPQQLAEEQERLLHRYRANLFVAQPNGQQGGAPVVDERDPSYRNLFGVLEFENRFGTLVTDFTHIRSGAIHLANGGFLILQLPELLADPRSWIRLKQSLKTGAVRPEEVGEQLGMTVIGLAPMPVPLALKVILVGPPLLYALLDAFDPDFDALFKVRAQFEPDSDTNSQSIATYAAFVQVNAERAGLKPFESSAVEELIRFGSRLAGRQDRLSTRLGLVADLCAEANQFAIDAGAGQVTAGHVAAAAAARDRRAGLVPDRIRKLIAERTLHVETKGRVVGQVNGLAVFVTGDHSFGLPMRITCRTGAGQQGVVDIERETERSGSIHTKGVLVLNGYLTGTFGRERSLAFNASLTFEQSYDEVEGDSASSAELYSILTSLADVPVRQDVAVTGSVDQFGNIQAVGGVTEKVEGFFDVCREIGLTGTEGVVLPASNVRNLVLRNDVIEAVERGEFHLWAVEHVEEGLEILTGLPARSQPGQVLGSSVFERVEAALDQMRKAAAGPVSLNGVWPSRRRR